MINKMGVMSCSRKDCEQIMCDTYIQEVGYVCYQCQNEFKEYLKTLDNQPTKENQIKKALETFMETNKGDYINGKKISVDEFFKSYQN